MDDKPTQEIIHEKHRGKAEAEQQLADLRAEVERLVLGLTWMAGYIITEREGTPDTAGWIKEALKMADLQKKEVTKLEEDLKWARTISTCNCGDGFTAEDPGTCGNCLATYYQDRVITGTVMARVGRPGPPRVSPLSRAVEPKTEAEETDPLPLPSY